MDLASPTAAFDPKPTSRGEVRTCLKCAVFPANLLRHVLLPREAVMVRRLWILCFLVEILAFLIVTDANYLVNREVDRNKQTWIRCLSGSRLDLASC